jgi:septal ring factor EnvC (AmiA/AmiB activator)
MGGARSDVAADNRLRGRGHEDALATAIAVATLAITLILVGVLPAQANHTPAHTQRQISQLEKQITSLQRQVKKLNNNLAGVRFEVFNCDVFDTSTPHTFSDGSIGYPLYENSTCVS